MAFTTDAQQSRSTTSMQKLNALVTVQSVDIARQTMVVVAAGADNDNRIDGTFTVGLDLTAIPAQARNKSAEAAGGGFCGAVIDKSTERHVGRKMILEGLKLTGDSTGSCRWLSTYRHERQRRPGIVHTYKTTDGHAQISGVTVFDHNAFDLGDGDRLNAFYERADKHFREGTTARGAKNDRDQVILRSSMPTSVLSMVIVDKQSGNVLENTVRLGLKQAKAEDFPEHYSQEERKGINNKAPRLPRNGTDYKELVAAFNEYAAQTYPAKDLLLLGVEGIHYKATRKGAGNRNMRTHELADIDRSPVGEIHRANKTSFRIDPADDDSVMRGAYVLTVNIQFSPNRGDTYNKYIDVNAEWPERDVNWLSKVKYEGVPLSLPEALSVPCRNAQNVQQREQNTSPDQNSTPGTGNSNPANSPSNQEHQPDPTIEHHQAPQPAADRVLPNDPAFAESQSLDQIEHTSTEQKGPEEVASSAIDNTGSDGVDEKKNIKPVVNESNQSQADKPVRDDADIIPSECPFIGAGGAMNMGM